MARRLPLAVGLLTLVAAAALVTVWLARERDIPASVAQPQPLFSTSLLPVAAGGTACASDVTVEPHSLEARLQVGTRGAAGPPLDLTIAAPGYRAATLLPGGYSDNAVVAIPLRPPRRALIASVCVRNAGSRAIALYAASSTRPSGRHPFGGDRSRSVTTVDGRRVPLSFDLSFHEQTRHALGARLTTTLDRIAAFRPGPLRPWFSWALLVLFLVGIPAGTLYAVLRTAMENIQDEDGTPGARRK